MERSEFRTNDSDQGHPLGEGVAIYSYAWCERRFGAFLLDCVIYLFFFGGIAYLMSSQGIDQVNESAFYVNGMILSYWVGLVALGVTPASWLCNIRIVDQRGRMPGLRRAFRRSLVPGTVWVFIALGAALFDPRIDAFYEAHPTAVEILLCGGGLLLFAYFFAYSYGFYRKAIPVPWHDVIAGTHVIEYRGTRKAALDRRIIAFRDLLIRVVTNPRHEERSTRARPVNRMKEEV